LRSRGKAGGVVKITYYRPGRFGGEFVSGRDHPTVEEHEKMKLEFLRLDDIENASLYNHQVDDAGMTALVVRSKAEDESAVARAKQAMLEAREAGEKITPSRLRHEGSLWLGAVLLKFADGEQEQARKRIQDLGLL
jgi:hypothetical protein